MKKIALVLLFSATLFVSWWTFFKKEEAKKVEVSYDPKTWSHFQQYKRLKMLMQGFGIQSVIDIPSKDFAYLQGQNLGIKQYIGITKTKEEQQDFQTKFGSELSTFINLEITIDPLPRVDLIFCWDCLCNQTTSQVKSALLQFKKSGAKYLLMRHYPQVQKNRKNKTGEFQPVNWNLEPYFFPDPILQVVEKKQTTQVYALWKIEDL